MSVSSREFEIAVKLPEHMAGHDSFAVGQIALRAKAVELESVGNAIREFDPVQVCTDEEVALAVQRLEQHGWSYFSRGRWWPTRTLDQAKKVAEDLNAQWEEVHSLASADDGEPNGMQQLRMSLRDHSYLRAVRPDGETVYVAPTWLVWSAGGHFAFGPNGLPCNQCHLAGAWEGLREEKDFEFWPSTEMERVRDLLESALASKPV